MISLQDFQSFIIIIFFLCFSQPYPEVQGFLAKYELALQMRDELEKYIADGWDSTESVIRRYKELYSNFTDSEDGVEETLEELSSQRRNQDSQETCLFDPENFNQGGRLMPEEREKLNPEDENKKSPSQDYDTFTREINPVSAEEKENFIPDRKSISPGVDGLSRRKKMDTVVLAKNIKEKSLKRLSEKRNNEGNKKRLKGMDNASETSGINDGIKSGFTSPVLTTRRRIKNLNGSNPVDSQK